MGEIGRNSEEGSASYFFLIAMGAAFVFLAGLTIASVVALGILLGVAWWKLAVVILATVIITKLLD